jgi:LPXTG-motif cell wall-anchored protein
MKTTVHKRLMLLAGLFVLSLLVVATGVQAAQAIQAPTLAQVQRHQGTASQTTPDSLQGLQAPTLAQVQQHAGAAASVPLVSALAGTQGRGGLALAHNPSASAAQTAASGTSSSTAWIAAGALAAVLLIGAWALARRRRQRVARASATSSGSADEAFCALNPEDALCRAA